MENGGEREGLKPAATDLNLPRGEQWKTRGLSRHPNQTTGTETSTGSGKPWKRKKKNNRWLSQKRIGRIPNRNRRYYLVTRWGPRVIGQTGVTKKTKRKHGFYKPEFNRKLEAILREGKRRKRVSVFRQLHGRKGRNDSPPQDQLKGRQMQWDARTGRDGGHERIGTVINDRRKPDKRLPISPRR